ncbi:MFS transporter [Marmoricola endophyticus]|uniref:MFS transporter n=1 Tax=Marmoricola endophyticus TaxID=2040280 RepID=UPI00166C7EAA|nr:MFS transporter [Marmoricola endophyticus]
MRPVVLAVAATMLIATTYGLARFGVGLFGPRLAAERPAVAGGFGLAASAQFFAYCLAAVGAAGFCDRRPGPGVVLAGLTATAGCVGIALARDPWLLVAAAFVAGLGAGFASPALVRLVDARVAPPLASLVQATVNTGTAVGLVVAGLIGFAGWSIALTWLVMAALCTLSALVPSRSARLASPSAGTVAASGRTRPGPSEAGAARALLRPASAAVLVGLGTALVWSYGPLILDGAGTVASPDVAWLWIALGLGGLLGPTASLLADGLGTTRAWRLLCGLLVVALLTLILAEQTGQAWWAYLAMAVFGFAYMSMSSTLILIARQSRPTGAAAATSTLFVALALGQSVGSLGIQTLLDQTGPALATAVAAACCAVAGCLLRRSRRS